MANEMNPIAPTKETENYRFTLVERYIGLGIMLLGGALEALALRYPALKGLGLVTIAVGGAKNAIAARTFLQVNGARQVAMIQAESPPMQPKNPS